MAFFPSTNILSFMKILALSLILGAILLAVPFSYGYRFWSILRILFILFLYPFCKEKPSWLYFFTMLLPFTLTIAFIEGIFWVRFLSLESYILFLYLGISCMPFHQKLFLERYIPLAFFFTTFPVFFWYLYLDILELSIDWLLLLCPLGIAFSSGKLILYEFFPLCYLFFCFFIKKNFFRNFT